MTKVTCFIAGMALYLLLWAPVLKAETGVIFDLNRDTAAGTIKQIPTGNTIAFEHVDLVTSLIREGDLVSYEVSTGPNNESGELATHIQILHEGRVINGGFVESQEIKEGDVLIIRGGALVKGNVVNKGGFLILTERAVVKGSIYSNGGGSTLITKGGVDGNVNHYGAGYLTIRDGSAVAGRVDAEEGDVVNISNSTVLNNVKILQSKIVSVSNSTFNGFLKIRGTLDHCDEIDNSVSRLKDTCP